MHITKLSVHVLGALTIPVGNKHLQTPTSHMLNCIYYKNTHQCLQVAVVYRFSVVCTEPREKHTHPNTHSSAIYPAVIHPCPSFLCKCTTNNTSTLMPIHHPSIQTSSTHASSFLRKCNAKSTSTFKHPFV